MRKALAREAESNVARLGIISAYPDEDWHAQRILAAARDRATAEVLSPFDFGADVAPGGSAILVRGEPHGRYDAFLTPRALGDEGEHELQLELYRTLSEDGAILVNDVAALTIAIDKFKTSWVLARAGLPTPRAIVAQRIGDAARGLAALGGSAVAKPLYGSLGIGVERVEREEQLAACLARWQAVYLQGWIEAGGRDLRVFVVGGRVEAAILRTARPGEFRTNVHQGGRAEPACLPEAVADLAVRATGLLGLDYGGVDLLEGPAGWVVIEVNGTPLFRGVQEATGLDMAVPIVEHALRKVQARHRGSSIDLGGSPWGDGAAAHGGEAS